MISLALLAVAVLYARGWYRLQQLYPDLLNTRRLVTFFAGLFALWVAVGSRLAGMDHLWLTAHMAQHLLLMTVIAPLILAGTPRFPLVCGLPKLFIRSHPPIDRLAARWLEHSRRHPAVCWLPGILSAHARAVAGSVCAQVATRLDTIFSFPWPVGRAST